MSEKKIPTRKCVGCGSGRPKIELIRVVRSPDGEISLDDKGKKPGRGAYICPSAACLAKARKAHRLERNLNCEISDEVYAALAAGIEKNASG